MNEQNEMASYYEPLEDALKDYAKLLSMFPTESARLESALSSAVEQRDRAVAEQERDDDPEPEPDPRLAGRREDVSSTVEDRSIFDDVDG